MTYLTIAEQETRAYMAGDVRLATALALCEDNQAEIDQLELELDDAKSDSVASWEHNNGPVKEYYDFFFECFAHLGSGRYPCPSVTSDYDKGVIFDAIHRGDA